MGDFSLSYREVIPDQSVTDQWKEITLTTGGTQSTLQDIQVSERANGYCYEDSTKYHTRNRFIYWRITSDVLELVEHSLDINLSGNHIKYRFIDTPILDGVSIHETIDSVVVLVPTVCSVHRLIFPHPDRFHKQEDLLGVHPDLAAPSIFANATVTDAKNQNSFFVFNNPNIANGQLPILASSYLHPETGEAYFVFAYLSTELLLIRQNIEGQSACMEMKGDTLMPRFLSGIAEKFRQKSSDSDNIVSLLIKPIQHEIFVFTLSRDCHLKVWSCSKGQCISVIDILVEMNVDNSKNLLQSAILKKAVNMNYEDSSLVIFLKFANTCQFYIFRPVMSSQQIRIERINNLHAPESDLIDFSLESTRLWSAWRCVDGESVVYIASLENSYWTPVILESLPEPEQYLSEDEQMDHRQVYLQHLFEPGRFPMHVISKALSIYNRSAVMSEATLSVSTLKLKICMAVDTEIQNLLNEQVVNDQEYVECAQWCWQKFYSCCIQYHQAGLKPLGILLLPSVSGAVFLKKSSFSILRPMDPLEHMMLCSEYASADQFENYTVLEDDLDTTEDVLKLFQIIVYLDQQMSDFFANSFERELHNLQAPDIILSNILHRILTEMDLEFTTQISDMLRDVTDSYKSIHKILELIRYENNTILMENGLKTGAYTQSFGSKLGNSLLSVSLKQQSKLRFTICRNLLLICHIIKSKEVNGSILESIRSVLTPELVVFTQASFVTYWLTNLPILNNDLTNTSIQRLNIIKLSPVFNIRSNTSLLESFICSTGGQKVHKTFSKIHLNSFTWDNTLLTYLNMFRKLIFPINGDIILPEFLLTVGQHVYLQKYVRLLSNWCEINVSTRNFFLACSFLTCGEYYKSKKLFEIAAKGVFTDPFFDEKVLKGTTDQKNPNKATVSYYLKVIQLYEMHKARDYAISIADIALNFVDNQDPLKATLFSIQFKHHLNLKHYAEAFNALNSNPDNERKSDNLRDLVKCLLDEKKLDVLFNFTYGSMDEMFSNIILARARATDAVSNIFYAFLYSYHIKTGPLCYRLAASVMYEQAIRLSQFQTAEALEKQVKCFLAAKNVLQLCDPDHAWLVRPSDSDDLEERVIFEPRAGTATLENLQIIKFKKQIEVVNIEAIKKDLAFASAKLKLARFESQTSTSITCPNELVCLLNNAGLFKTALHICHVFNVPNELVFETLTKHCVILTEEDQPNAWDWLVENDLQDLPANRDKAADVVWQLLQNYLEKYEKPQMTVLHQVVCRKIINMRAYIPYWLLASYKERNAAELLRLFHSSGRLEEAIVLVNDYLLAVLGYGKEYYGFKTALTAHSQAVCIPDFAVKRLIQELNIQNMKNMEKPYVKEYANLKGLFEKYLETTMRISNEMCQVKMSALRCI